MSNRASTSAQTTTLTLPPSPTTSPDGNYADDNETRPIPDPTHVVDIPYHIFSRRQKWKLVYLVSLAGCFSPLSSNIYFPAISTIASDLGVSSSLVALTITVYMVVQGIAPSFFGAASDSSGRRLVFITTLSIYTAANLALAFTVNYPMLLVLRGLQAAGSAATISISAGLIADVATSSERGAFMGTNAGIRMVGQAIGPVIGGGLNSAWGFRSIFWFLFAFSVLVLTLLVILLPESQRQIAGNGSVRLHGIQKPLIYMLSPPKTWIRSPATSKSQIPAISLKKLLAPIAHITEKDILALLVWGALVYTVWSMVTSSTAYSLLRGFPYLNEWQLGLCFLPNGIGCVAGSICTGRLLDQSFKEVQMQYRKENGILSEVDGNANKSFPFERARLRLMPHFSATFLVAIALYGPSFEFSDIRRYYGANLAAPLGLQFIIAFTSTAIFTINSTLLVDCFPSGSAGATALNNLCRCLLGAVGVSAIQPLIDTVRIMRAFLILTGIVLLFSPLIWVQSRWGGKWRMQRETRMAQRNTPGDEA
ncbi:MFS general substrate transporter [Sarocladium strictum]